jgi:hypothetical protein
VTTLATGILEQAALFDCQLLVEPSTAASETSEPSACIKMMYDGMPGAPNTNVDGDMAFNRTRAGCSTNCDTTVIVTSRWMPVGSDGYACRSTGRNVGAPALLERRATLLWTPSGATTPLVNEYVSVESAPRSASFTDSSRSSVVVTALPGQAVKLTANNGSSIVRIAMPCDTGTGTSSEAWFPYLDTSISYEVVPTSICVPVDGSAPETQDLAEEFFALYSSGSTTGSGCTGPTGGETVNVATDELQGCLMSEGVFDAIGGECRRGAQ